MESTKIRQRIVAALSSNYDEVTRREIAFHMTDWLPDLRELLVLYQTPESLTEEQVRERLMGFLVPAPWHIAAASKLLTGNPVTDIFGVGAVGLPEKEE